jgi:hypothetical protein
VTSAPAETFRAGKVSLKFGEALPLARVKKRIRTVDVLVPADRAISDVITDPPGSRDEDLDAGDQLLMALGVAMFWFGSAAEKLFRRTSRPVAPGRAHRASLFRVHDGSSPGHRGIAVAFDSAVD